MDNIFTIPKLCKAQRGWYIHYRFNGEQIRDSYGLNKIEDLNERERDYIVVCAQLYKDLKAGFSPLLPDAFRSYSNMSINEALDFAMEKKIPNLSPKTIADYNCSVRFVKKAVLKCKLQHLNIVNTKRIHIKAILEQAQKTDEWSNHTYNKRLDHLKAVLGELLQFDIIETNPVTAIKKLKVEQSLAHTPPTPEQAKMIRQILEPNHYQFWIFIFMMYDTGLRPAEILSIQLSEVAMSIDLITLTPKNAKNRTKYRFIGISPLLKALLNTMNFEGLPKDYYLFGSFREPGKGNIGKTVDFIPAPTKIKRDTATKRWETIIILGAKINVSMYAIKKLGANNKLKAGIPLSVISEQFGHSEEETTKIYTTQLEQINRDLIKDKSPDWY